MAELVTVKSTLAPRADGGQVVALWERDPDHPGGEAFVAGDAPVEVARTAGVTAKLRSRELIEVGEDVEPEVPRGRGGRRTAPPPATTTAATAPTTTTPAP